MSEFVYDPHRIEEHWQAEWEREGLYHAREDTGKPKKYVLEMFPYPSGDIHMGHVRNYTIGDVIARQAAMAGFEVLHPIGWDAFGLPAENAAIKSDSHPATWTYANIEKQMASFKRMGFSYDWDRTVKSCDVDYYRWGQWIFLKMWERGLVERKSSPVNWCPSCATVLANEQVVGDGVCWRCKSVVDEARAGAVVLQDHRLRAAAARRPGRPSGLARARQDDAGELDRAQRGCRGRVHALRRARRAHRRAHHRLHDSARHAVRLHVLPARAGAPARGEARWWHAVRRGGR